MLFVASCAPRYADFFPYYDNGTKKPFVSLLPVYNSLGTAQTEAFAQNLSKQIRRKLKTTGKVYCPPESIDARVLESVPLSELVQTASLDVFKRFQGSDYVTTMDLIEYQIVPYKRQTITPLYIANLADDQAQVLKIALRFSIIDIRGQVPKYARQEIVHSNHMIPLDANQANFDMVRSRLARDMEEKIERTVCTLK